MLPESTSDNISDNNINRLIGVFCNLIGMFLDICRIFLGGHPMICTLGISTLVGMSSIGGCWMWMMDMIM